MSGRHSGVVYRRAPSVFISTGIGIGSALLGIRFSFFEIGWLNLLLSTAWLLLVSQGFESLDSRDGLAGGVAAIASAFFIWLAVASGQVYLIIILAGVLGGSLLMLFYRGRPPGDGVWSNRLGQFVIGCLLALIGMRLESSGRAIPGVILGTSIVNLGTWMVPGVILGTAIISQVFNVERWLRCQFGFEHGQAEPRRLSDHLALQFGWDRRRVTRALWLASGFFGISALAMSYLKPLPAHLLLGLLGLAVLAAVNFQAVRALGKGPLLIYGYTLAVVLLFIGSLKYRYLNKLFPGVMPGNIGWDFFTIPRAFDYLIHGVNMYHRAPAAYQSNYGPYATEPFSPHPLLAVVPGGIIYLLPPFVAYTGFVVFSLAALGMLYWQFSRFAINVWQRGLIALFLFASWPLYGMLWMGQMQVFPVIAYGLVSIALLRGLAGAESWSGLFIVGCLVGLFSKPLLLLLLPAVLTARLTRRTATTTLAIYAAVSLLFVIVPFLNPGQAPLSDWLSGRISFRGFVDSANMYHWTYILFSRGASLATNWREVFSLTTILNVVLPSNFAIWFGQCLMWAIVGYLAWVAARDRPKDWTFYLLLLSALVLNAAYLVTYTLVFEYQYTTLAIVPIGLLLLLSRTRDRGLRRYLGLAWLLYLPYLLPSAYGLVVPHPTVDVFWDYSAETLAQMTLYRASRVMPALLIVMALIMAMRRARLLADAGSPLSLEGTVNA